MGKNKLKIAISGKSGCGNTTVSKIIAETLNFTFINFTFRTLAEEKGLTLKEVLEKAAKDDYWDKEVDSRQVFLAKKAESCVLGSRLAIWMLPDADLKVYLSASPEVRAERIMRREGGKLEDVTAFTLERDRQDTERYKRIYKIDNDDYTIADFVINTNDLNVRQICALILEKVNAK
jgi:cytidylate kinase